VRNIGAPEIMLILLLVVLLFGAKKLPDTARGLGRSLRIFKAETRGLRDDDDEPAPADEPAPRPAPREVTGAVVDEPTRVDRIAPHRPAQVRPETVHTQTHGSALGTSSLGSSSLHDADPSGADGDGQGRGPTGTAER
jgi:sec-independent protein translocase protein TatA